MTIPAKKHNEILRLLAEGKLSWSEIGKRLGVSRRSVKTRVGADSMPEPHYCRRHHTETPVDIYRENVATGLAPCMACAAEDRRDRHGLSVDFDEADRCQLAMKSGQMEEARKIRSGEIVCRKKN